MTKPFCWISNSSNACASLSLPWASMLNEYCDENVIKYASKCRPKMALQMSCHLEDLKIASNEDLKCKLASNEDLKC
jgi:hypothetical protein